VEKQISINGKDAGPFVALNFAINAFEAINLVLDGGTPEDTENAQFYAYLGAERLKTLRDCVKQYVETE
jgi:hypothetical protein